MRLWCGGRGENTWSDSGAERDATAGRVRGLSWPRLPAPVPVAGNGQVLPLRERHASHSPFWTLRLAPRHASLGSGSKNASPVLSLLPSPRWPCPRWPRHGGETSRTWPPSVGGGPWPRSRSKPVTSCQDSNCRSEPRRPPHHPAGPPAPADPMLTPDGKAKQIRVGSQPRDPVGGRYVADSTLLCSPRVALTVPVNSRYILVTSHVRLPCLSVL